MAEPFYITTAIPYVNARPHIGFALEIVLADAIARAHRDAGYNVCFQTGTDDNSLKNVRAAEAAGTGVAELVACTARHYRALPSALDLSVDRFVATSAEDGHVRCAQTLWRACEPQIETRDYRGLYCVGCEAFVTAPCPEHPEPPEPVAERNHFLLLSRQGRAARAAVEAGVVEIVPDVRRREILAAIDAGVEDLSISRSVERARGWGVPVPGDPTQVQYVWFDALSNYLTGLGYPERTDAFRRWWSGPGRVVHVIGKNITRFHAILWPAILRAAGLERSLTLLVHGFITSGGRKVSKSAGGGLDPAALADRHGSDVVRYALLRRDAASDADLTEHEIERVARAELADQLGNLAGRVLALVARAGTGLPPAEPGPLERDLLVRAVEAERSAERAFIDLQPHRAIEVVRALVGEANRAIVVAAPWRAPDTAEARAHLAAQTEVLRTVARAYRPVVPRAAAELARRLSDPAAPAAPLFPKR